MSTDEEKSYSEIFVVWNDLINLVGRLIPVNKGRAAVHGTVKFKNDENLSFSSPPADYDILRKRFMFLCRFVAKLYGTNVIHRKMGLTNSEQNNFLLLSKDHHLLN